MSKSGYKVNWPMRIAGILLCLCLFTTYLTSGLYARYTTRAEGEDSARVAKFSVDINSDLLKQEEVVKLAVVPGEEHYDIEIENKSEVSVKCRLQVKNTTNNIPMTYAFDGSDIDAQGFGNSRVISSGSTETVDFCVKWEVSEEAINYIGMVDLVSIVIYVEQVD